MFLCGIWRVSKSFGPKFLNSVTEKRYRFVVESNPVVIECTRIKNSSHSIAGIPLCPNRLSKMKIHFFNALQNWITPYRTPLPVWSAKNFARKLVPIPSANSPRQTFVPRCGPGYVKQRLNDLKMRYVIRKRKKRDKITYLNYKITSITRAGGFVWNQI